MGWASGVVVFVILWWLVFFMCLPIGVRPPHEVGEQAQEGNEPGAPVKTHLPLKLLATTVIAGALWGVARWLIDSGLLSIQGG